MIFIFVILLKNWPAALKNVPIELGCSLETATVAGETWGAASLILAGTIPEEFTPEASEKNAVDAISEATPDVLDATVPVAADDKPVAKEPNAESLFTLISFEICLDVL